MLETDQFGNLGVEAQDQSESSLFQMSRVLRIFFLVRAPGRRSLPPAPRGDGPKFRGRKCHLTSTAVGGLVVGDYVGDSDGLVAVGAQAPRAKAPGEQVAVRAPAFADVAGVALGAPVDGLGAWASLGW